MTGRFEGKVALVTGAGSGIGKACAHAFAKEGAKVVVSDVVASGSEETVRSIRETGGEAIFVRCDVSLSDEKREPGARPEETMANGTNPQKKHLLRRLVKKVLIHDRRTIEVWYCLPNRASVRTAAYLAPRMCQSAIPPGDGRTRRLLPDRACRPGCLQRALRGRTLRANRRNRPRPQGSLPKRQCRHPDAPGGQRSGGERRSFVRGNPRPPNEPKKPRVAELLRKAIEWQAMLESGKGNNQAEIARQEGITRAQITQVMNLLRLTPETGERTPSQPEPSCNFLTTERALRPIAVTAEHSVRLRE